MRKTRLLCLFFCLGMLLCACNRLPAEEPTPTPEPMEEPAVETEQEPKQEPAEESKEQEPSTEEGKEVFDADKKIPFTWQEGDYYTAGVLVIMRSSCSDYLRPYTVEDFPELSLSSVEPRLTGAFGGTTEEEWEAYFAIDETRRSEFQWRVFLTLKEPSPENLKNACLALNEREDVAEIYLLSNASKKQETEKEVWTQWFTPWGEEYTDYSYLTLEIRPTHVDGAKPYQTEDFPEIGALRLECRYGKTKSDNLCELSVCALVTVYLDGLSEEECRALCERLGERDDVYRAELGRDSIDWVD